MVVQNRQEWESGGNVVSLDQKRREIAERLEQDRVEDTFSDYPTTPLFVLSCSCGCEALAVFTDGEHFFAECVDCGEPMGYPLLTFMSGQY